MEIICFLWRMLTRKGDLSIWFAIFLVLFTSFLLMTKKMETSIKIKPLKDLSYAIKDSHKKCLKNISRDLMVAATDQKGWLKKKAIEQGKALGLAQAFFIMQLNAKEQGIDLESLGLDVDLEAMMLEIGE